MSVIYNAIKIDSQIATSLYDSVYIRNHEIISDALSDSFSAVSQKITAVKGDSVTTYRVPSWEQISYSASKDYFLFYVHDHEKQSKHLAVVSQDAETTALYPKEFPASGLESAQAYAKQALAKLRRA